MRGATNLSHQSVAAGGARTGRGGHRRGERRRFGKAISWSQYALERLSGFERRPIKPGANPFQRGADRTRFGRILCRARMRAKGVATITEAICIGRSNIPARPNSNAISTTSRPHSSAVNVEERSCRWRRRQRDPRPQERILQERRRIAGAIAAAMRTEYKTIIDAGFLCSSTTPATPSPRPHGAAASFEDYRRWPRATGRDYQSRHRGPCRPIASLSRVLGLMARAACQRRPAQGHRRL